MHKAQWKKSKKEAAAKQAAEEAAVEAAEGAQAEEAVIEEAAAGPALELAEEVHQPQLEPNRGVAAPPGVCDDESFLDEDHASTDDEKHDRDDHDNGDPQHSGEEHQQWSSGETSDGDPFDEGRPEEARDSELDPLSGENSNPRKPKAVFENRVPGLGEDGLVFDLAQVLCAIQAGTKATRATMKQVHALLAALMPNTKVSLSVCDAQFVSGARSMLYTIAHIHKSDSVCIQLCT
jgi:hypothetical protein